MATTDEILDAATKLGKQIAAHEAGKRFLSTSKQFEQDMTAQRAIADFQRFAQEMNQKQRSGLPIEVTDKRKLEELQMAMVSHPLLRSMQTAHMDYLDLMRKVDEALTKEVEGEAAPATAGAPGAAGAGPGAAAPGGGSPLLGGI